MNSSGQGKLKLLWPARVDFNPQRPQQLRHPAAQRQRPVHGGVTASAQRDQECGILYRRPMMHYDIFMPGAYPATVSVARQHFFAVASETPQGMPARTVAG